MKAHIQEATDSLHAEQLQSARAKYLSRCQSSNTMKNSQKNIPLEDVINILKSEIQELR